MSQHQVSYQNSNNQILIGSELLRQFVYCPKIPYFRHVLNIRPPTTIKMDKGNEKYDQLRKILILYQEKIKKRLPPEIVHLQEGYTNLRIFNDNLGLAAQVDIFIPLPYDTFTQYVLEHFTNAVKILKYFEVMYGSPNTVGQIVEVKFRVSPPQSQKVAAHHKIQLAFQALLLQHHFNLPVLLGTVHFLPNHSEQFTLLYPQDIAKVVKIIRKLRYHLVTEDPPEPTPHPAKCTNCEFRRYCHHA